jgi:hypothetical protein
MQIWAPGRQALLKLKIQNDPGVTPWLTILLTSNISSQLRITTPRRIIITRPRTTTHRVSMTRPSDTPRPRIITVSWRTSTLPAHTATRTSND